MFKESSKLNNTALTIPTILFFYSIMPFASVYYLRLRKRADLFVSERARRPRHFILGLLVTRYQHTYLKHGI